MRARDLIKELEKAIAAHGNCTVFFPPDDRNTSWLVEVCQVGYRVDCPNGHELDMYEEEGITLE